jgi:RimJ/RimL family protein N-acetyltransferase
MAMVIDAGTCVLRQWRLDDEDALIGQANDRRVSINLRDRFPYPYTQTHAATWLADTVATQPPRSFAITDPSSGELAGGVTLMPQTDIERINAEIGYWLGVAWWGRGMSAAAVTAATTYAFDALEFERIFGIVFARNAASARVLEKAGFRLEATMPHSAVKEGLILDQFMYAVTKPEWTR